MDSFRQFVKWISKVDVLELGNSSSIVLLMIYFSAPVIALSGFYPRFTLGRYDDVTGRAMVYAMLGIVCFSCAYVLTKRKSRLSGTVPTSLRYEWNNLRAWIAFAGLFGGGFLIKVVRILTGQYLSNIYLDPSDAFFLVKFMISLNILHYMGIAVAFVSYFHLLKKGDPRWKAWRNTAWITSAVAIVFGLVSVTGRLSLITPILIYLITKHYLCNRSHARIIIAALAVVFILFPLKMAMRDFSAALNHYFAGNKEVFAWHTQRSDRDLMRNWDFVDSLRYSGALETDRYAELNVGMGGISELTIDATAGRIGQLHVFSSVVERTKEYLYGRNIPYLFNHLGVPNSVIERIVGIGAGTEFGEKYGVVSEAITGVAPTQMGDLYLNFGLPGVLLGMMALGYLYRKLFEKLAYIPYPSGIFIYSILWIVVLHGLEQSISAAYGAALQLFLILFVIQLFISRVPLFGKANLLDRRSHSL